MIENKIAKSGLITLDLETFMPQESEVLPFDIAPFLFKGLILREKSFRAEISDYDFARFENKHVAVFCSADALIPMWAYMLIAKNFANVSIQSLHFGTVEQAVKQLAVEKIEQLDVAQYLDARVIIKGCGDRGADEAMYLLMTKRLLPVVKTLMYGEPCSTVPVYKKK